MKRLFVFISLLIFSSFVFAEIISFDDIRSHYQVFMNNPTLDNLRELSQQLDLFNQTDFYNTMKSKYPAYKNTFEELNNNVKSSLGTFDNPWIPDSRKILDTLSVNKISNSFFDFVLQQNIYIAKTTFYYRVFFITLSIFLALAFLTTFFILKNLREKKEALLQSKYMLQGQESERKRISEDLHDTIAQNLKAQKLQILNARDNLFTANDLQENPQGDGEVGLYGSDIQQKIEEMQNEWSDIYTSATENLKGIRNICQNLFPPNFANQKMEWIVAELCLNTEKKHGIKCTYSVSEDCIVNTFDEENKLHVFRILQEAVNNAIWHGKCSSIKITMTKKEFRIADDGEGFDVAETMATKQNHFGLRSIMERSKILGGKAVITSGDKGTEIVVTI